MSSEDRINFVIQKKDGAGLLRDKKTIVRIEEQFNVRASLTSGQHSSEGEWVTLHGTSKNTSKAKKYILALCIPEFVANVKTKNQFGCLLFGENSRLRNELEREYQTVIQPLSSSGNIRVQGSEIDVCLTVSKLADLMDTMDHGRRPDSEPPGQPAPSCGNPYETSASLSADLDLQLKTAIQHMDADPSNIEKLSDSVKRALLEGLTSDLEGKRTRQEVMSRGVDPQKEQRIEFFVRLGFLREKVEAVLESLGPDTMDDDILARLVKVSSRSPSSTGQKVKNLSNSRPRGYSGEPLLSTPVPAKDPSLLRPIVIDGSNVAMRHGNGRLFSCNGILIAVRWFLQKGHQQVTVFVPSWRKEASRPETPISDQEILYQLERDNYLVFTPSRRIGTKRIVCYDDRFIVRLAAMTDGIIVSNDNFRDLMDEKPEWRNTIEQRLLMFTFVNDIFMIPEDPLGRHGPRLEEFLQKDLRTVQALKGSVSTESKSAQVCPYGDRCTFGPKCRFYHPEREGKEVRTPSRSPTPSPVPTDRRRPEGSSRDIEDLSHLPPSDEHFKDNDPSPGISIEELRMKMQRVGVQPRQGSPTKYVDPRTVDPRPVEPYPPHHEVRGFTHPMTAKHSSFHLNLQHPTDKFPPTLAQSSPAIHVQHPPPDMLSSGRYHSHSSTTPRDPMAREYPSHSFPQAYPHSQGAMHMQETEPRKVFLPRDPQLPGPSMPLLPRDSHGIPPPTILRDHPARVPSGLKGEQTHHSSRVPQYLYSPEAFRSGFDSRYSSQQPTSSAPHYPGAYYHSKAPDVIHPAHSQDQEHPSLIPRFPGHYQEQEHIPQYPGHHPEQERLPQFTGHTHHHDQEHPSLIPRYAGHHPEQERLPQFTGHTHHHDQEHPSLIPRYAGHHPEQERLPQFTGHTHHHDQEHPSLIPRYAGHHPEQERLPQFTGHTHHHDQEHPSLIPRYAGHHPEQERLPQFIGHTHHHEQEHPSLISRYAGHPVNQHHHTSSAVLPITPPSERYHHGRGGYASHEPATPRYHSAPCNPIHPYEHPYEQRQADQSIFAPPPAKPYPRTQRSLSLPHCLQPYSQPTSHSYSHQLGRLREVHAGGTEREGLDHSATSYPETREESYLSPRQSELGRYNSVLYERATSVLPDCEEAIRSVMLNNPQVTDLVTLVELVKRQLEN